MQKQFPWSSLLEEGVLRMCCDFFGAYLCVGVILVKLQICGFVEIALLLCCSPVGLFYAWGASFSENTSGGLLLNKDNFIYNFQFILFNKIYFWGFESFSSFVILISLYLLLCWFLFHVSLDFMKLTKLL